MIKKVYNTAPGWVQDHLQQMYSGSIYKLDIFILHEILEQSFEILSNKEIKNNHKISDWEYSTCNEYIVNNPTNINIDDNIDYVKKRSNITGFQPNPEILYKVRQNPSFVCELADTLVLPPYGVVISELNKFPAESIRHYDPRGSDIHRLQKTWRNYGRVSTIKEILSNRGRQKYDKTVCGSLIPCRVNPEQMAYGHWLLELLPKLRGFEEYMRKSGREITVFVHPGMSNWQKELLNSIETNATFETLGEDPTFAKKFIMPVGSEARGFCDDDLHWVSEKLIQKYSDEIREYSFSDRVYLSRKNYSRSVKNEGPLTDMLAEYGFETYRPANMSIGEQIALFKNANTITGPVGSAFSNIIFCENTKLFPIHPPDTFHTYFYELAAALNIESIPVPADCNEQNQSISRPSNSFTGMGYISNKYNEDFRISLRRMENILKQNLTSV